MLIVFGGLPGTGKTTIARRLAQRRSATYLRIDAIEQAIRDTAVLAGDAGASGNAVANTLAESNFAIGQVVVADCVNPVGESRQAWRAITARSNVRLIEVELVCSDPTEHRRRLEGRTSDLPGLVPPNWQGVLARRYDPGGRTTSGHRHRAPQRGRGCRGSGASHRRMSRRSLQSSRRIGPHTLNRNSSTSPSRTT